MTSLPHWSPTTLLEVFRGRKVAELDRRQEERHKEGSKVGCEGNGSKAGTSERGTCLEGMEFDHSMD